MNSTSFLLEKIGGLAVEYVKAWDEYHKTVTDEFQRGVSRECVVSQLDPLWRDVIETRRRMEAEIRGFLTGD